jgi:hypothetical protein
LEDALKEDTAKYNKLFLTHALTKWRLITQIMKMKMGHETFANATLDEVIQAIQKGSNNLYIEQVRTLQSQLAGLQEEMTAYLQEKEQLTFESQEKALKIDMLVRDLQGAQQDSGRLRAHVEQANTEVRALKDELEQVQRARKVLSDLLD